jgi:hypothetical protein
MKAADARGTTSKHAGSRKHSSRKHTPTKTETATVRIGGVKVTVKATMPVHAKARGLARAPVMDQEGAQQDLLRLWPAPGGEAEPRQPPGAPPCLDTRPLDDVACCSALALATSLRLAGRTVGADDVMALYELTAADDDAGATILATLEAAAEHGLGNLRPTGFRELAGVGAQSRLVLKPRPAAETQTRQLTARPLGMQLSASAGPQPPASPALILGLDLPGPHAVLAVGDTWWSWGRPWHRSAFPHAVIEETWAVTW